jgi:hypothetical protein
MTFATLNQIGSMQHSFDRDWSYIDTFWVKGSKSDARKSAVGIEMFTNRDEMKGN